MHDAMMTHQHKRTQHLDGEATNEDGRKTSELISLDEFIEVHAEKLHRNTKMVAEVKVLGHLDDVVLVVRILDRIR